MMVLLAKGLVCLASIMCLSSAFGQEKELIGQEFKNYRMKMQEALKGWKLQDQLTIKELKQEKALKLSEIDLKLKEKLSAVDDEFDKKISNLRVMMMRKTDELQKKTELSYIYSVKLQQEKFNKKKTFLVAFNREKLNIEKEYQQKLLEEKLESLDNKHELLNDKKPDFLIDIHNVTEKVWVQKKFCAVEKNYKYQDLWLNYLYVQYQKLTPLRIRLLEIAYKEDIYTQSLESYQTSYDKLAVLSENMKVKPKSLAFLSNMIMKYQMKLEETSSTHEKQKNEILYLKSKLKKNFDLATTNINCELDKSKLAISENWKSDRLVTYSNM